MVNGEVFFDLLQEGGEGMGCAAVVAVVYHAEMLPCPRERHEETAGILLYLLLCPAAAAGITAVDGAVDSTVSNSSPLALCTVEMIYRSWSDPPQRSASLVVQRSVT